MDNLQSLFDKRQYELVISLTKDSLDPKDIFLRIASFTCLGKIDEALDEVEKNASILEKANPYQLMKIHFELLLSKKLFDEARLALKHYENLPYISQEAEELMREMKDRIEEEAHPETHSEFIPIDEVLDTLEKSEDLKEISRVLFALKNYNLNIYIDSLKKFMVRKEVHPNFRTYALILLVDNKFDEEIEFLSLNGFIKVNPARIVPPFMSKEFNEVCRLITEKSDKNMTVTETALHLFNCYVMDTYPLDIYTDDKEVLSEAIVDIAYSYLGQELSSKDENVYKTAIKIKSIVEGTPEIKL